MRAERTKLDRPRSVQVKAHLPITQLSAAGSWIPMFLKRKTKRWWRPMAAARAGTRPSGRCSPSRFRMSNLASRAHGSLQTRMPMVRSRIKAWMHRKQSPRQSKAVPVGIPTLHSAPRCQSSHLAQRSIITTVAHLISGPVSQFNRDRADGSPSATRSFSHLRA